MNNYKICAFTGHRPKSFLFGYNEQNEDCIRLKKELEEKITQSIKDGYNYFIVGGAQGVDMWAAEIILELKAIYEYIKLEIAVPFPNYNSAWSNEQKKRYKLIAFKSDMIVTLSDQYYKEAYLYRNQYMVNKASRLIAVFNGRPSGTANTINLAEKKNKEIILIKV